MSDFTTDSSKVRMSSTVSKRLGDIETLKEIAAFNAREKQAKLASKLMHGGKPMSQFGKRVAIDMLRTFPYMDPYEHDGKTVSRTTATAEYIVSTIPDKLVVKYQAEIDEGIACARNALQSAFRRSRNSQSQATRPTRQA